MHSPQGQFSIIWRIHVARSWDERLNGSANRGKRFLRSASDIYGALEEVYGPGKELGLLDSGSDPGLLVARQSLIGGRSILRLGRSVGRCANESLSNCW